MEWQDGKPSEDKNVNGSNLLQLVEKEKIILRGILLPK